MRLSPSALRRVVGVAISVALSTLACARNDLLVDYANVTPVGDDPPWTFNTETPAPGEIAAGTLIPPSPVVAGLPTPTLRPTLDVSNSPTPDATRASTLSRQTVEQYTVQRNDTLNKIGARYGLTAQQIAQANGLLVTDVLHVGQVLLIPLPEDAVRGPELKLLPDSELVYGPGAIDFNIDAFVQSRGGYLATYREDVDGYLLDGQQPTETLTGSEIVRIVALRYSVNPRLLLAVLEYQAGWVTNPAPDGNMLVYPLRRVEVGREGLYRQLAWAANQLNQGYYGWRVGWLISFNFDDGALRLVAPGLNAGTVGVQNYFAKVMAVQEWTGAVSAPGLARTYQALFGNPFRLAIEPLLPAGLTQPELALPFEPGKVWAFTGGPHGAWDAGSAWAALDFAPPAQAEGCVQSDEWVTASAPGLVVRSEYGGVMVDLDGDGYEGTGWALFYMHVETRDRIAVGSAVNVGDRLGHPSCEGGVANGTHIHLARKYNGEWIEASGPLAFVLDGWLSAGLGKEYDGTLSHAGVILEACDCRAAGNEISR